MYLALGTRPDIAQAVTTCAQFSSNPGRKHWQAIKRILRYLQGTRSLGLEFRRESGILRAYVMSDSDWASNVDNRKSRTGLVVYLCGAPVIWVSRLQKSHALSSCEAEYIALCDAMTDAYG